MPMPYTHDKLGSMLAASRVDVDATLAKGLPAVGTNINVPALDQMVVFSIAAPDQLCCLASTLEGVLQIPR